MRRVGTGLPWLQPLAEEYAQLHEEFKRKAGDYGATDTKELKPSQKRKQPDSSDVYPDSNKYDSVDLASRHGSVVCSVVWTSWDGRTWSQGVFFCCCCLSSATEPFFL
jgi:hypothetical protein